MKQTTKFYRIVINLGVWHLKRYYIERPVQGKVYKEWGWLCFKYIVG